MIAASPAMLLRSMNGSGKPLITLFAMLISKKTMVSEEEIATMTGNTSKTIRTGLNVLAEMGLVTRTHYHSGWTLTYDGRQMLLDSPMLLPTGHADGPSSLDSATSQLSAGQPGDSVNYRVESVKITECESVKLIKKNQDSESILTSDSTDSVLRTKIYRICEAVEVLGWEALWENIVERLLQNAERRKYGNAHLPDESDLIGWIAHCFANRAVLKSPAGVVARNILSNRRPTKRYKENPSDYLPDEFFRAAGLEQMIPVRVEPPVEELPLFAADQEMPSRFDLEAAEDGFEADASVHLMADHRWSYAEAWDKCKTILQSDMPRGPFEQWLKPARLKAVQDEVLVVQAGSQYAAEWLHGRVRSTAVRLLAGICNRSVDIQFVA